MQVTVSGSGPYTLSFKDANGVDQGFNVTLDKPPTPATASLCSRPGAARRTSRRR